MVLCLLWLVNNFIVKLVCFSLNKKCYMSKINFVYYLHGFLKLPNTHLSDQTKEYLCISASCKNYNFKIKQKFKQKLFEQL